MVEITITYCVPCRFQSKAIRDADALLREFSERVAGLRLIPGDHGVYDVSLDGEVVFSLDAERTGFPESGELIRRIRARIRRNA